MSKIKRRVEGLWWKLLIAVLLVFGPIILVGYLYYINSSCATGVWNCFEFEAIMLGGGVLLFTLPIVVILFVWEVWRKIKVKKKSDNI